MPAETRPVSSQDSRMLRARASSPANSKETMPDGATPVFRGLSRARRPAITASVRTRSGTNARFCADLDSHSKGCRGIILVLPLSNCDSPACPQLAGEPITPHPGTRHRRIPPPAPPTPRPPHPGSPRGRSWGRSTAPSAPLLLPVAPVRRLPPPPGLHR